MSGILAQLSDDLAETVDAVAPSVVRVDGRRRIGASGIVWDDGLIVTAQHVIEREDNISVGLPDGSTAPAELVGGDPSTDLALLRIQTQGLAAAERIEANALRVGNIVLAVGRPGKTARATFGIVSALGGAWRSSSGSSIDSYVQTDVVMYPGFSGGPLVTANGAVAGLNTSALIRGISITVPVSTIATVVDALLTHGRIRQGYLGVGSQPVKLPEALAEKLDQTSGVLLTSVEPGSPADKGGLTMGDTIVQLNGETVRSPDDLRQHLGAEKIGIDTPLKVIKSGEIRDLTVVIGERS